MFLSPSYTHTQSLPKAPTLVGSANLISMLQGFSETALRIKDANCYSRCYWKIKEPPTEQNCRFIFRRLNTNTPYPSPHQLPLSSWRFWTSSLSPSPHAPPLPLK